MKHIYRSLTLAAALVLTLAGVGMAQTNFVILLDGAQEVPPVATPASGSGTAVLNAAQTQLTVSYSFSGLIGTQSNQHIHNGAVGVAGGVSKNLPPGSPVIGFVWTSSDGTQPLTPALVTELLAERLYVNIHSTFRPGGEIRGQLLLEQVGTESVSWSRIKNLLQ
ncbi:MAG: CHRD domain-containing protein [Candidatus Eisenbacteria bacterium]|nr:CHRD domain-containing protein [Candidatus Eisenbacteria bacterium]